jgi:hypothetical protein
MHDRPTLTLLPHHQQDHGSACQRDKQGCRSRGGRGKPHTLGRRRPRCTPGQVRDMRARLRRRVQCEATRIHSIEASPWHGSQEGTQTTLSAHSPAPPKQHVGPTARSLTPQRSKSNKRNGMNELKPPARTPPHHITTHTPHPPHHVAERVSIRRMCCQCLPPLLFIMCLVTYLN